jgi:hypothetical protein
MLMTSPVQNNRQMQPECSAAICEEIGDRLRVSLAHQPVLSERMTMLVDQLEDEQPSAPRNNKGR